MAQEKMRLDDIASTLINDQLSGDDDPANEDDAPLEVQDDEEGLELFDTDDNDDEDDASTGDDDAEENDDEGEELELSEEEEEDDDSQGSDDNENYLDVQDDDLIELSIDGKVEYRPLRELKEALSGEGAIHKRLNEATEMRETARKELDVGRQTLDTQRQQLVKLVSEFEQHLFPQLVAQPDPALRQTNPNEYLLQQDAYREDQDRIAKGRQALAANLKQANDASAQNTQNWNKQQSQLLVQKRPVFADKEKAPAAAKNVLKVAEKYGVSAAELKSIGDHRLYMMALDLAEFMDLKETVKKKEVKTGKRAPRRLRSGVAERKTAARANQRKNQARTKKARETGKVADVAQTLLTPAR